MKPVVLLDVFSLCLSPRMLHFVHSSHFVLSIIHWCFSFSVSCYGMFEGVSILWSSLDGPVSDTRSSFSGLSQASLLSVCCFFKVATLFHAYVFSGYRVFVLLILMISSLLCGVFSKSLMLPHPSPGLIIHPFIGKVSLWSSVMISMYLLTISSKFDLFTKWIPLFWNLFFLLSFIRTSWPMTNCWYS